MSFRNDKGRRLKSYPVAVLSRAGFSQQRSRCSSSAGSGRSDEREF